MVETKFGSKMLLIGIFILFTSAVQITSMQVSLRIPKYVMFGGTGTLYCDYNVKHEQIHKVEWLKEENKIFQFIRGRNPPFRNFTCAGGIIDWNHTDRKKLTLTKLNFDATGTYSCEVTTDTPIFTKQSEEHHMVVIEIQRHHPVLTFNQVNYTVGDILDVNCTSSPATPVPELTWLLNSELANQSFTRSFPEQTISSSMLQLTMKIREEYVPQIRLTCLSTIPAYLGHSAAFEEYADYRSKTIVVDISPSPTESAQTLNSNSGNFLKINRVFPAVISALAAVKIL